MDKPIDAIFNLLTLNTLEDRLDHVMKEKAKGNELVKIKKYEEALAEYLTIANSIENSLETFKEKNSTNTEIMNQYKLILSNIAMCLSKLGRFQESVKYDIKIFQKLDKNFDKSYARLVSSYLSQDKFTMANYFASLLKHYFNEIILSKYSDILDKLEGERSKHQKSIGELLSGS